MSKFKNPLKSPIKNPKVAVDEPNPWLKIEHNHNWLPANDGKEYVCGDCGLRKPA